MDNPRDGVSAFDTVAASYATARPGYPPALFQAIEELAARPLLDADIVDVGAGTGIATSLLHGRGARVVAVEPGRAMATELHRSLPHVPLVRAVGEALPFRAASADLITYAQSWHWTDPRKSVEEAGRVLRPGGAMVLWWNVVDPEVSWAVEQERRIAVHASIPAFPGLHPGYPPTGVTDTVADVLWRCNRNLDPVAHRLRWSRKVSVETHLMQLGSRSNIAALGDVSAAQIVVDERARVLEEFPCGIVEEVYTVDLTIARF